MTRQQNLFFLAHLCHVDPVVVDELRVGDFAQLLTGIREHRAAQQPKPERSSR